jgi:hypothetical protein
MHSNPAPNPSSPSSPVPAINNAPSAVTKQEQSSPAATCTIGPAVGIFTAVSLLTSPATRRMPSAPSSPRPAACAAPQLSTASVWYRAQLSGTPQRAVPIRRCNRRFQLQSARPPVGHLVMLRGCVTRSFGLPCVLPAPIAGNHRMHTNRAAISAKLRPSASRGAAIAVQLCSTAARSVAVVDRDI